MEDPKTTPEAPEEEKNDKGDGEFTQEQLAIINSKIASARKEAESRVRSEYADYDEAMKAKIELEKIKESQLSKEEKLTKEKEAAEERAEAAIKQVNETLKRTEFSLVAARLGVKNPSDAYVLADKTGVDIKEGKVVGVEEAVQSLIDAGRVVMAEHPPASFNGGAGKPDGPSQVHIPAEFNDAADNFSLSADQKKAAAKRYADQKKNRR